MKIIGLVGEDTNDTLAIRNLLELQFKEQIRFKTLLRKKNGCQLDNQSSIRALKAELSGDAVDMIIFIRDLDGLPSEEQKLRKRREWFDKFNVIVQKKGIFLLNIYELEALILADIETFNKEYKVNIRNVGNVMYKVKPKEFLVQKSAGQQKVYEERHCPELFRRLRYQVLVNGCLYFREFSEQFVARIKK